MRRTAALLAALLGAATSVHVADVHADASPTAATPPSPNACPITPPPLESGSTPTYPGRFWNPKRYGTGWDFLYDDRLADNNLFVLYWFTYDSQNRPVWLISWPRVVPSNDGHKRYAADLLLPHWDGQRVDTFQTVGSVAVTFPNGTGTRAAIAWQWNEAPTAPSQIECVYDYFRESSLGLPGEPPPGVLNQAYTANWYDSQLNTAVGGYGSWGFDLVIGIDPAQNYMQIVTPQIFDGNGYPVWLQYKQQFGQSQPPKNNASNPGLLFYTRGKNGVPITDCTAQNQASNSACITEKDLTAGVAPSTKLNRFYHDFTGVARGTIAMNINAQLSSTPGDVLVWPTPALPPYYSSLDPAVPVTRTTDTDRIVTDRTLCFVQQANTNCPLIVSYTSSQTFSTVYRYDLNNPTVPPVAVQANTGPEGTIPQSLPIGSRVKYKLFGGSGTPANGATPLSESAEVRVIGHVDVADQPLVSLDADLPTHDPTVGTAAGDAGTSGGAATYTIPISVPPGRNGMQPEIALSYSSRGGNGVAGMGFSLSGVSSIHRCPRTQAQDGRVRPVRLDADDALCLDGQRLMAIGNAPYGQANTVYRTEVDSYAKVTQLGGSLLGDNTCFLVETKSGRRMQYGTPITETCSSSTANNARIKPVGGASTLTWLVTKVEDHADNAMVYTYTNRDGSGPVRETLLSNISYTLPTLQSGTRHVTFTYENRPAGPYSNDNAISAQAGGLSSQVKRLTKVTTLVGTDKVRDYTLSYSDPVLGPDLSQYSGRSLLRSVTECAYDTDVAPSSACRETTKFRWNDGSVANKDVFDRMPLNGLVPPVLPTAAEMVAAYPPITMQSHDTSGSGTETPVTTFTLQQMAADPNDVIFFTQTGDVNGDGNREVVIRTRTANQTYVYQIAVTTPNRGFRNAVTIGADTPFDGSGYDFNGNGYAEGLRHSHAGEPAMMHIVRWKKDRGYWPTGTSTPGFDDLFESVATNIPETGGAMLERVADFDGDGRPDVMMKRFNQCGASTGGPQLSIYRNVTTAAAPGAFTLVATHCLMQTVSKPVQGEKIDLVTDLDGDGAADILLWTDVGGYHTLTSVLSLPSPLPADQKLRVTAAGTLGLGTETELLDRIANWMDINGDGLDDLLFANTNSGDWKVHLNRGNFTFTPTIEIASQGNVGLKPGQGSSFKYANHLKQSDVDGDGRVELLRPARLAGAVCTAFVETPCVSDPEHPATCNVYACPDDPTKDDEPLDPLHPFRPILPNGNTSLGAFATRLYDEHHPGANFDFSAYVMNAVKFVIGPVDPATSLPTITAVDTPTSIVSTLGNPGEGTDLFGDGLADYVALLGCPDGCAAATFSPVAGVVLPTTLPNNEPVTTLVTQGYRPYLNTNTGVTRLDERSTRAAPRLPELLDVVTNGLGDEATWDYYPLSSNAGRATNDLPLYSTVQNPALSYADDDHFYFTSSMPVVASMYRSNGIGDIVGSRSMRYGYSEAMYNARGRGFQGFRTVTQEPELPIADASRRTRTVTVFEQKFPFAGAVKTASMFVASPSSPGGFALVRKDTNTWSDSLMPGELRVHQPHQDESLGEQFETNGACAGTSVSTRTTNSSWDAYGNFERQNVVISESDPPANSSCLRFIANQTTTTTNTYINEDKPWWPGRLTQMRVDTSVAYKAGHALPVGASNPARSITTDFEWDETTRTMLSKTQSDGANLWQSTAYIYPAVDGYGLPESTTASGSDLASRTVAFGYSADRYAVSSSTNALGYVNRTRIRERDGQAATSIDPNGAATANTYDVFGTLVRVDTYKPNPIAPQNNPGPVLQRLEPPMRIAVTRCTAPGSCGGYGESTAGETYAAYRVTTVKEGAPTQARWFDKLGREVKSASRGFDPSETMPSLSFGPWVQSTKTYDAFGLVASTSAPHCRAGSTLCTQTAVRTSTYTYDALQRVLTRQIPAPDGPNGTTGPAIARDVFTTYAYSGGETTVTTGRAAPGGGCTGCLTDVRYSNVLGKLMLAKDTMQNLTAYWHDANGRPVAIRDAKGSVNIADYNAFGQRTRTVDPNRGTWTFSYNSADEVLRQVDARGVVTTYTYDEIGRPRTRTATQSGAAQGIPVNHVAETTLDTWTYRNSAFPRGVPNTVSRTLNGAETWKETYTYDPAGRTSQIQSDILNGATTETFFTDLEYDETYNREKVRNYPSGLRVQSTYTAYGQPHRIRDADLQQDYLTIDKRDNWGGIAQQTYGNFAVGLFTANPGSGQSQSRVWKNGSPTGEQVDSFEYAYDVFGNLAKQTRNSQVSTGLETYTYDNLHRLTLSSSSTSEPVYGSVSYAYDEVGNMLAKTDYSDWLGDRPTMPYQYLAADHPNAVTKVTQGTKERNYSYDKNGNLISGYEKNGGVTGGEIEAWYDPANLPRKLYRNPYSVTFDYAPTGQRYREENNGTVKITLPFGLERLGPKHYRHQLGEVVVRREITGETQFEARNTVFYNYTDRLGSTAAIADGNGVIADGERLTFDAFGMARDADFTSRYTGLNPATGNVGVLSLGTKTDRGFTGHEHLDNLQLIHMNGRAYDFRLGRFLSADPFVQAPDNSQSLNPYSYVFNNPLSGSDPTGYQSQSCSEMADDAPPASGSCTFRLHDSRSANKLGEEATLNFGDPSTGANSGGDSQASNGAGSQSFGGSVADIGARAGSIGASPGATANSAASPTPYRYNTPETPTPLDAIDVRPNGSRTVEYRVAYEWWIYPSYVRDLNAWIDRAVKARAEHDFGRMVHIVADAGSMAAICAATSGGCLFLGAIDSADQAMQGNYVMAAIGVAGTVAGGGALIVEIRTASNAGKVATSAMRATSPGRFGGYFKDPVINRAGGEVHLSEGKIWEQDFNPIVQQAVNEGRQVHILSGAHGSLTGEITAHADFFRIDYQYWGNNPLVKIHDASAISPQRMEGILNNSRGTVIGGLCHSSLCLLDKVK